MKDHKDSIETNSTVALKAGVWYVVSTILVKTVSIVTTPIFTRLLTISEYGEVATFSTWYSLLIVLCTLNLTYSIGRAKLDFQDRLDQYIGAMQILSAIITFFISVVILIFIEFFTEVMGLNSFSIVILIIYLFFSPSISFFQNGYRYRYRYKENIFIALYITLSSVFFSLILLFAIDFQDRAILRMIGITMSTVILSVIFWWRSIKQDNLKINIEYWKYGVAISLPLVLHTVSLHILAQSDRIFISKICGAADVGIYSLIYNYGIIISVLINAISDGWLPWFHDNFFMNNYDAIRKNIKYLMLFMCYLSLACVALAPEAIIILGGEQYLSGLSCVFPIVVGILCQYTYTHYVNVELHLKKTKYVSCGTIFAALLNVVLNIIFIPLFGFVAAAYTSLLSYVCLLFVHQFISEKILGVKLYKSIFMFGVVLITTILAAILTLTYDNLAIRYSLILIGFISFLLVFRNYILMYISKFIRS